ncbi:ImmA/IrrE family metallo-endopeptidase [Williamsia sp.]|uniref:ImmA/IrrE family metallo-endopeptidase n=1 Tax=Williamsia sp. TaxID=1872085 RepID=UPI001A337D72|nr:ImmA/IrrE family metallo-endopeptidase [Williamsia sp.]MBJ7287550.1 ImmA/IrrE family metallo-endopeptidase [Williamsia sp.]
MAVAEALVREVAPGPMWTADSFVVDESLRRTRPIRVVTARDDSTFGEGVTGQLWPLEGYDEIVLVADLSADERRYVIAHEMGHLLLGHPRRVTPERWVGWLGALPPAIVESHLGSFACKAGSHAPSDLSPLTDYERAEQEAEWFATIVLARVDEKRARISASRGHDRGALMIDRIARTFGYYCVAVSMF